MTESITQNSEFVKSLNGDCFCKIDNPAYTFPFKVDHFQQHAFACIDKDENVLVLAHTGSGKTVPAIYAIANYIRKGKKVVYTSPIKALSNQKYKEFRELFEEKFSQEIGQEINVGLMTGDNKIKPDADVVIMTTEILRNALYDIGEKGKTKKDDFFEENFIGQIGCVIFDEVHYINDKDRGHVWEETLILLDPSVTLVMLSATIDRPEEFAKWIGDNKKKPVNMLLTNHRVVPLEHFIYVNDKLHKVQDKNECFDDKQYDIALTEYRDINKNKKTSNQYVINELVDFLSLESMFQTIFFVFSRKNCELFARSVTTQVVSLEVGSTIEKIFDNHMHKFKEQYSKIPQYHLIRDLVKKGIAFHHSGLLFILKEIIEILFEMGYIKILFATETFAVGVNMPTRTIVFTSLEKHTNEGKRCLHTAEYKQMAGRAGRRGKDKKGNVIILPLYEFPQRSELKTIMLGKMPHIESKFSINYSFRLKIIQSNSKNMEEFVGDSMFNKDNSSQLIIELSNLEKLEKELDSIKSEIEIEDYSRFEELSSMYERTGFTLNKKQMKEKNKLAKKLDMEKYNRYNQLSSQLYKSQQTISYLENYVVNESFKIDRVLFNLGYLNADGSEVTVKGLLASQINECNALVLTEMICQNMFDDLEPSEICSVLAMFIEDGRSETNLHTVKCNDNVKKTLVKVNEIIENLIDTEKKHNVNMYQYGYYDIYYNYIEVVYHWANGCNLTEAFSIIETYEGNFIKNILKVNNIVSDVMNLSKICGNLKLIPKLENIEEILVRDIVTANSLYLS